MKSNKIEQLIAEITAREPDEPAITLVSSQKFASGFSVLFTHSPKIDKNSTREAYAESLKGFGLEKLPQVPWSMGHTRVIPKLGSVSYAVHFYSLAQLEIEVSTDIGSKMLNSKLATSADLKKNIEDARLALRTECKEIKKILNMIDDPKLKAIYGAA